MGRPHRAEIPGGTYHVTTRGSNRQPIYWTDEDRWLFLRLLGIVSVKYSWTVLAYCLMTNHFHLVLQIADGGLSAGMQWLNGTCSRVTNQRYGRTAHLFRNRFSSRLIESDAQLLVACRYVVLNPVKAGLCSRPDEWPWSSYRATVGLEPRPAFLADGELLRRFAPSVPEARRLYAEFVAEGVAEVVAAADDPVRHTIVAVSDTATGV
jgi:REP element-mobilizing transposase RayT